MKRDMDLVRKLLLTVEGFPSEQFPIEGFSEEQIFFHSHLLTDAGLAEGADISNRRMPTGAITTHLTWDDYDLLDAARNDTAWAKVKGAAAKVGGVTFDVMTAMLVAVVKGQSIKIVTECSRPRLLWDKVYKAREPFHLYQ